MISLLNFSPGISSYQIHFFGKGSSIFYDVTLWGWLTTTTPIFTNRHIAACLPPFHNLCNVTLLASHFIIIKCCNYEDVYSTCWQYVVKLSWAFRLWKLHINSLLHSLMYHTKGLLLLLSIPINYEMPGAEVIPYRSVQPILDWCFSSLPYVNYYGSFLNLVSTPM